MTLGCRLSLVFDNDTTGADGPKTFAERHLVPFFHEDIQRLDSMVHPVPGLPRHGIESRHVLDISQRPGGLAPCKPLLQTYFAGDWTEIDVVACREAGGFVFASVLATLLDIPLVLIRKAVKLPPPTISVIKPLSHILSSASERAEHRDGPQCDFQRNIGGADRRCACNRDDALCGATAFEQRWHQYWDRRGHGRSRVSCSPRPGSVAWRGFGKVHILSLLVFDSA